MMAKVELLYGGRSGICYVNGVRCEIIKWWQKWDYYMLAEVGLLHSGRSGIAT